MIGSFAGVSFRVSYGHVLNFHSLSKDASGRYATHEVIGLKPKKEFLGPGFDSAQFTMELHASQGVNPTEVIRVMEEYSQSGRYSYFILGGRNLGKYVVTSISQAYEIIMQSGKVMYAKLDVGLEEYR